MDDGLTTVFENVIRDEGRHHAGGLALFNGQRLGADMLKRLAELLAQLLSMVQAGPQMVVSQIERIKGRLSRVQKTRAFAELDRSEERRVGKECRWRWVSDTYSR